MSRATLNVATREIDAQAVLQELEDSIRVLWRINRKCLALALNPASFPMEREDNRSMAIDTEFKLRLLFSIRRAGQARPRIARRVLQAVTA